MYVIAQLELRTWYESAPLRRNALVALKALRAASLPCARRTSCW